MQKPICSVFDKRTALYTDLFVVRHIGDAVRQFDIVRKDTENKIGKNPEDFELVQIGLWDDLNGKMDMLPNRITLQQGQDGLSS